MAVVAGVDMGLGGGALAAAGVRVRLGGVSVAMAAGVRVRLGGRSVAVTAGVRVMSSDWVTVAAGSRLG